MTRREARSHLCIVRAGVVTSVNALARTTRVRDRTAIDLAIDDIADEFSERIDSFVDLVIDRCRREVAGWAEINSPEVWELIKDITKRSRLAQVDSLRRGFELPKESPPSDREAAAFAVQARISLPAALKSFRIGYAVAWDTWLGLIESADLSEADRGELTRRVAHYLVTYDNAIADHFTLSYEEAERDRRLGGQPDLEALRSLLAEHRDELHDCSYDLDGRHVAVIVSGADAARAAEALAVKYDGPELMLEVGTEWWGWLGVTESILEPVRNLVATVVPDLDFRMALGNPGDALEGFRRSHRQAGGANRVARRTGARITFYEDVALEALALEDQRQAREFSAESLAPLDVDPRRSRELRQTLTAYFDASQNAASASASLGVHEQTVTRRLRLIEQRLGGPINERRSQLELALSLQRLLAP